jgi:hypothetical protein
MASKIIASMTAKIDFKLVHLNVLYAL